VDLTETPEPIYVERNEEDSESDENYSDNIEEGS
jgi:hypothetical protein